MIFDMSNLFDAWMGRQRPRVSKGLAKAIQWKEWQSLDLLLSPCSCFSVCPTVPASSPRSNQEGGRSKRVDGLVYSLGLREEAAHPV